MHIGHQVSSRAYPAIVLIRLVNGDADGVLEDRVIHAEGPYPDVLPVVPFKGGRHGIAGCIGYDDNGVVSRCQGRGGLVVRGIPVLPRKAEG